MSRTRRTLTAEDILALADEVPGYHYWVEFCRAVEAGETPPDEIMQELASAFRAIMAGEATAEDALNLTRQGRPPVTLTDGDWRAAIVADILDEADAGRTLREAEAIVQGRHQLPYSARTLRDWRKRYGALADWMRAMRRRVQQDRARLAKK